MFVKDILAKEMRVDCRGLEESRNIQIENLENTVIVRSGNKKTDSYLILSYKKSISKPYQDKPSEGIFQINLEKGKKNDLLLNFLHNTYVKSKCLSMSDLCLKFNQRVYSINIEIFPIQVNGDLFKLCIEGINRIIYILDLKTYFKPKLVQYVGIGDRILLDPTEDESLCCDWQMNVVMKSSREFLLIEKIGKAIPMTCFSTVITNTMTKSII